MHTPWLAPTQPGATSRPQLTPDPQGCVRIPLKQVIGRRRMQGTWPLEDGRQGTLTLELSWMGTLMM